MSRFDDTIAAPATPAEPAERAVVRVAGPGAAASLKGLFVPDDPAAWFDPQNARRYPGMLTLPGLRSPVPGAVWLWPTERSYCGQPTAEIHLIGALPLVEALIEGLAASGVRPADRGEFTLRAVLAGRMDLLQAEAVLGVIDAPDSDTLARALTQLGGGLSGPLGELRERLLGDLADLEAGLDFVEEDIEFVDRDALAARLAAARDEAGRLLAAAAARSLPPGPPRVVMVGPANAGKSTLLNALVGREAARVSPVAGTTRDWVSAAVTLPGGTVVDWVDTAGFLDSADPVDLAAGRLRDSLLDDAALIVLCRPVGDPTEFPLAGSALADRPDVLTVRTKADLGPVDGLAVSAAGNSAADGVSKGAGDGLDRLLDVVAQRLASRTGSESQTLLATTAARCRESLRTAGEALEAALSLATAGAGDELIALELRRGLDALGHVLGRVDHEDVLDRLFSRFCIGK